MLCIPRTSHVPVSSTSVLPLASSLSFSISIYFSADCLVEQSFWWHALGIFISCRLAAVRIRAHIRRVNPRLLRSVPGRADEQYELQLRDAESLQLELVFAQPRGARIFAMAVVGDGATATAGPPGPPELWACVGTEAVLWGWFDSL